jgi:hypothetical protein
MATGRNRVFWAALLIFCMHVSYSSSEKAPKTPRSEGHSILPSKTRMGSRRQVLAAANKRIASLGRKKKLSEARSAFDDVKLVHGIQQDVVSLFFRPIENNLHSNIHTNAHGNQVPTEE